MKCTQKPDSGPSIAATNKRDNSMALAAFLKSTGLAPNLVAAFKLARPIGVSQVKHRRLMFHNMSYANP
jgi:hypothetical protein